jgi:hypothetical protein
MKSENVDKYHVREKKTDLLDVDSGQSDRQSEILSGTQLV